MTLRTLTGIVLLIFSSYVFAGAVSFCGVCDNYKLVQKGQDLLIMCPPNPVPIMTYKNCVNPKAKKVAGEVNITCNSGISPPPIKTSKP